MDILSEYVQDDGLVAIQLGGLAGDGLYRVALVVVRAANAAEWLAGHQAEAQALIDAGQYNEIIAAKVTAETAREDFRNLPGWATWSGQEAAGYLHDNILAGMTKEQVDAWIDANVGGATLAAVLVSVRTALKLLAGAVIDGRDLGHQNEARAIMFLRDIAVK